MKEFSEKVKNMFVGIQEAGAKLELNGITLLTGANGSGKSLLRTQLPFIFAEELGVSAEKANRMIASTSMAARTGTRADLGGLSGVMRDTSWTATSQNTYHSIRGLFNTCEKSGAKYLVIDEPEIGCGKETVLALVAFINTRLSELYTGELLGALIISHSDIVAEELVFDHFINMEGLDTVDSWLNREIVPTDLTFLDDNELFSYIKHQNK